MALVPAATNIAQMTVTDRAGKYATTSIHVASTVTGVTDAAFVALKNAVVGMSDGAMMKAELKRYAVNDAPGVAASGAFDTVRDKVIFEFLDAAGIPLKIELPGPREAILMPDGVTVDLSNVLVQGFRDTMFAAGATSEGGALTLLHKAYRKQNKGLKNRR